MKLDLGAWSVDVIQSPAWGDTAAIHTWSSIWNEVPPEFPLQQMWDWPLGDAGASSILLRIKSLEDADVAHIGLRLHRLRALPGAWYLRVPKFGVGIPAWALRATLVAVEHLAAHWFRVARVRVELCMLERPDLLPEIEREARILGFSVLPPLEYQHTLLVPIPRGPAEAEAQIHRNVFKSKRKIERAGHVIRLVDDERYTERLAALFAETMRRTGAQFVAPDMAKVIHTSRDQPDRYRLLGLFNFGAAHPDSLLAFRWCGRAGSYAYDLLAASTRLSDESGQIPMMPSIMLDMFDWAGSLGATHFDFGGVVLDGDPRGNAVAGITRFKMQFGGNVTRVGSDLLIEPRLGWKVLDRIQRMLR